MKRNILGAIVLITILGCNKEIDYEDIYNKDKELLNQSAIEICEYFHLFEDKYFLNKQLGVVLLNNFILREATVLDNTKQLLSNYKKWDIRAFDENYIEYVVYRTSGWLTWKDGYIIYSDNDSINLEERYNGNYSHILRSGKLDNNWYYVELSRSVD